MHVLFLLWVSFGCIYFFVHSRFLSCLSDEDTISWCSWLFSWSNVCGIISIHSRYFWSIFFLPHVTYIRGRHWRWGVICLVYYLVTSTCVCMFMHYLSVSYHLAPHHFRLIDGDHFRLFGVSICICVQYVAGSTVRCIYIWC